METEIMAGEEFQIVDKGQFTLKPELQWRALLTGANSFTIVIPVAYGKEEIEDALNFYGYPFYKSSGKELYYATVSSVELENIKTILAQY